MGQGKIRVLLLLSPSLSLTNYSEVESQYVYIINRKMLTDNILEVLHLLSKNKLFIFKDQVVSCNVACVLNQFS